MSQPINTRLFEIALGLSLGTLLGYFYEIPKFTWNYIYFGIGLILAIRYLLITLYRPKFWWFFRLWFFCLWTAISVLHYINHRPIEPLKISNIQIKGTAKHHHNDEKVLHAFEVQNRLKPWGKTARYLALYYCPEQNIRFKVALVSDDSLLISSLDLNQKFLDTYAFGTLEAIDPEFKKYF